ncbi:MAG: hypothetical protein R6V26_11225 [Roseovarius sp.]
MIGKISDAVDQNGRCHARLGVLKDLRAITSRYPDRLSVIEEPVGVPYGYCPRIGRQDMNLAGSFI